MLKENKWIELSLKLPKYLAAGGGIAVYLDGEIYIFGGSLGKETYKLDKKTLKWIRLEDMNEARRGISHSCLEWNGSIWVFGGIGLKSVERYDPKENKWIKMP